MIRGNLLGRRNGRFLTFGLPWIFKWALAPAIDVVELHRFGGREAWIVACMVMLIVTRLSPAMVDLKAHFQLLLVMVVRNNMFCATRDVATDSLAVSTLHVDERGCANGVVLGAQSPGILLGAGGAIGWSCCRSSRAGHTSR